MDVDVTSSYQSPTFTTKLAKQMNEDLVLFSRGKVG
jgi:hypothetical protein